MSPEAKKLGAQSAFVGDFDDGDLLSSGLTKREAFAMAAMQGWLASESEDSGHFHQVQTDPNTGLETHRRTVHPLKNGTEDYSQPAVECPVKRTAAQNLAFHAVQQADALLEELAKEVK